MSIIVTTLEELGEDGVPTPLLDAILENLLKQNEKPASYHLAQQVLQQCTVRRWPARPPLVAQRRNAECLESVSSAGRPAAAAASLHRGLPAHRQRGERRVRDPRGVADPPQGAHRDNA